MDDETTDENVESDTSGTYFPTLTFEESRVLGALMEKESTTPDSYPLSLNALVNACNQKSSRDPVTEFDDRTVEQAVEGLRAKDLAVRITTAGSRVPKVKHSVDRVYSRLDKAGQALLCVLMLRGPQTLGELRSRTERIHFFPDLGRVESAVSDLITYDEMPLAELQPPGTVKRVKTYAHLLCGEATSDAGSTAVPVATTPVTQAASSPQGSGLQEQVDALKEEVTALRAEVDALKQDLGQ